MQAEPDERRPGVMRQRAVGARGGGVRPVLELVIELAFVRPFGVELEAAALERVAGVQAEPRGLDIGVYLSC